MQDADEWLNEALPTYNSYAYSQPGLWSKMGTTKFWFHDFMDGIAFAASAYAGGGVTKAVGTGIQGLVGAEKVAKGLSKIGLNAHKANLLGATAYNTIAESAMEAGETQKSLEAIFISKGYSPEQAKLKAAKGAGETFWWNAAALFAPNFVQNSFFHGG